MNVNLDTKYKNKWKGWADFFEHNKREFYNFIEAKEKSYLDGEHITFKKKTFVTTVLLCNKVPIEITSQFLGHSNMSLILASYAKVVQKSVSKEMKNL